jgi:uncharacterized peroxidase-related enzyme
LSAKKVDEEDQSVLLEALASDHRQVELAPADRAMLDYSTKLTRTPSSVEVSDVEGLRAVGFDDRGIHDICAIVGYYAFVNRMADGLGVELE